MTEFRDVRLQPPKRQIPPCESRRQADDTRLWYWHARIRGIRKLERRSHVLPGTELAFAHEVERLPTRLWPWHDGTIKDKTAIFRQINKEKVAAHHDALEFPDGQIVLLTFLREGQQATVLQLPAEPKTVVESEAQRRAAYVG